jgi:ubiquinone/menaquinone biosynthesis C-methylase UbiE
MKFLLLLTLLVHSVCSFSQEISRRDAWKVGLGVSTGVVYGKLLGDVLSRVARGIQYPDEHERRVSSTVQEALLLSATAGKSSLRVLEVGMGSDCRLIRRGMYDHAFEKLAEMGVTTVEIVGIDLTAPKDEAVKEAKEYLKTSPLQVNLSVFEGDITQFPGSDTTTFDAAISCLTLCSVVDQEVAVTRIRDLIRPQGGCLGYVEHVAVNPTEDYKFLEWQQQKLDPLQQALADNCHLHRYTEQTIASVFGVNQQRATLVTEERFLVDNMWPVSCQARGVVQRNA